MLNASYEVDWFEILVVEVWVCTEPIGDVLFEALQVIEMPRSVQRKMDGWAECLKRERHIVEDVNFSPPSISILMKFGSRLIT